MLAKDVAVGEVVVVIARPPFVDTASALSRTSRRSSCSRPATFSVIRKGERSPSALRSVRRPPARS